MAYRKKTLASVADPFRENEEYLWYHHGLQTKKAMHGGGMRTVDPSISIHANKELLQEQMQATGRLEQLSQLEQQNLQKMDRNAEYIIQNQAKMDRNAEKLDHTLDKL